VAGKLKEATCGLAKAPMADIWIRFYEKSGFKAVGTPDFWLGDVMFTYKVYFICLKE